MERERLNAGATWCGSRHLYVFGGIDGDEELLDTIERYNSYLDIWQTLKVNLRAATSNLSVHALNS